MTFVFPVLLGGLALIGVPVLIHLIMRQKPKTLPFPAFRFLLQRHRTNLRKLRLRHLLLLTLRVLVIAALTLALARPKVFSDQLNLSADRPVAAVLLFDTSYSMEYKVSGGLSRLEEAKKRGLELLDELPEGSRVSVLDTAESVPTGKGAWHKSPYEARERINALRPQPANAPVTTRLENAYRLFADLALSRDDPGRALPRFLCVFSDRTRACWDSARLDSLQENSDLIPPPLERLQQTGNSIPTLVELLQQLRQQIPPPPAQDYPEQKLIDQLQQLRERIPTLHSDDYPDQALVTLLTGVRGKGRELIGLLQQLRERTPETAKEYRQQLLDALETGLRELQGVHQVFVDVGVDNPVNLGIVDLQFPEDGGRNVPRQIFAPEESFVLRATVQATGQDYDSTLLCQVGSETITQPVALKAGQKKAVAFEINCRNLAPGPHQVEVRLPADDLLAFDNRRFASFALREPRKVLILTDEPNHALAWKAAIEARQEARFRCDVESTKNFDRGRLASSQVVYLFNVAVPTHDLWEALKEYVLQGGRLAVVPAGKKIDLKAYNDDKVAQEILPGKLSVIVAQKEPGAVWNWDDDSIYQHPLLRPVREWKGLGPVDFIQVPRGAMFSWDVQPTADVIVRYADDKKRPALLERRFGQEGGTGRVLLFTTRLDSAEPAWNNYMDRLNSFCVVLPGLTTSYLAGDAETVRLNFLSGQDVPVVTLPLAGRSPVYTLQGPGVLETVSAAERQTVLTFKQAVAPGNYVVEDQKRGQAGAFSVNMPPEECLLTRVPVQEIEALFGRDAVVPVSRRSSLREALQGHWDQPLELLPLLMLVLLLVLALENLLGNLFYRREPGPQP